MKVLVSSGDDHLPEDVARLEGDRPAAPGPAATADELEPLAADVPGALTRRPGPPTRPAIQLDRWFLQAHAYRDEQAAKVSVLGQLFGSSVQHVAAGVVHEAKRYALVRTDTGRPVEMGVAVRLSVAISRLDADAELTLPSIAAHAQLGSAEARAGITVVGYTGPLGDCLPAPRKLDVETYVEYVEAFRRMQAIIFGADGLRHIHPALLSYDEAAPAAGDA